MVEEETFTDCGRKVGRVGVSEIVRSLPAVLTSIELHAKVFTWKTDLVSLAEHFPHLSSIRFGFHYIGDNPALEKIASIAVTRKIPLVRQTE